MRLVGIIGAMDQEVAQLKEQMKSVSVKEKASMVFFQGTINGKPAVVVQSGIGKVNAGICTQILIDDYHVDCVINTGIAGSLKNEINIGDIVISTDTLQHDVDATNFGYKLGYIPGMDTHSFPADETLRTIAEKACHEANPELGVFQGRVVSGDQFIADADRKKTLIEEFQGYCTEMEGAAIAQAAYLNKVPYVVIRAISDKADNSASVDYPTFERQAISHSVKLVSKMMEML